MAIVYFDSSAFLKLVVEETGSELAVELWRTCDAAVSSRLAYPEVRAALAAAGRGRRIDARELDDAERGWDELWAGTRPVELTSAVEQHAGHLARAHALFGGDAVHLASALALRSPGVVVAAWDRRLRSGVAAAGLLLAPAQLAE